MVFDRDSLYNHQVRGISQVEEKGYVVEYYLANSEASIRLARAKSAHASRNLVSVSIYWE